MDADRARVLCLVSPVLVVVLAETSEDTFCNSSNIALLQNALLSFKMDYAP